MEKIGKVVIWGFDNNSHTHHYIHWAWHNTFKYLGYDTYWFSENNHPVDFDYSNTLFITEGYADAGIPMDATSTYVVHVCINPEKYIGRVGRLIDMRYLMDYLSDVNYNYVLDKNTKMKISDCTFYEELQDNSGLTKHSSSPTPMSYEAMYTCWATDLLPHEINLEDAEAPRENQIYWFGSANPYNTMEINNFAQECSRNGIGFVSNDPWSNPQSFETVREKTKMSYLSPDIRSASNGNGHKVTGYIACRLFKSISYGQLGITNSKHMYDIMDGTVVYNTDESKLFYDAVKQKDNIELIREQMILVRDKHTFVNRVNDLLRIIKKDF